MLRNILLFIGIAISISAQGSSTCERPNSSEEFLYSENFHFGQSKEEMKRLYEQTYNSSARLKGRAFYDRATRQYVIPYQTSIYSDTSPKLIPLPKNFIRSITKHAETALRLNYVEYIFFPDMGHSHFYLESKKMAKLKTMPIENFDKLYYALFTDPELRILYHTAEQLKMREGENSTGPLIEDKQLMWRYFTRNIVGINNSSDILEIHYNAEPKFNSVTHLPGFDDWSSGFNISANKNGCFAFQHRNGDTLYFDISLQDLPMKNTNYSDGN